MFSTKNFTSCLLLVCLLLGTQELIAQCSPTPHTGGTTFAYGVTDSVTPSQPAPQPYIVCDNASLFYFGNDPDTVYLEGSARLVVKSCFNLVVYMRNNCQLHCDTTLQTRVFRDVIYDPTFTSFVDTAGSTFKHFTSCTAMAYNYAAFPNGSSPCALPTDLASATSEGSWSIYPNPAHTTLHLQMPVSWNRVAQCDIYGLDGRRIAQQAISSTNADIDVSQWVAGTYFVRIMQGSHAMTRIVVVDHR